MSGNLDARATENLLNSIAAVVVPHFQRHFDEHPEDFSLPMSERISDIASISVPIDVSYFIIEENKQKVSELLKSEAENAQTNLLQLLFGVNNDNAYEAIYGLMTPPTLRSTGDDEEGYEVQIQIRIEHLIKFKPKHEEANTDINRVKAVIFSAITERLELKHLVEFYEQRHSVNESRANQRHYSTKSGQPPIDIVDLTAAAFFTIALNKHKDALDKQNQTDAGAAASQPRLPTVNLAEFFSHIQDPLIQNLGLMLEKQAPDNKQKQPEKKPKRKYFFSGMLPSYGRSKSKTVTKDLEPSDLLSQGEIQQLSTNFQNKLTDLCLNFPVETLEMITNNRLSCIDIAELISDLVEHLFPKGIDADEYVKSKDIDILDARVLHDQLFDLLKARYTLEDAIIKTPSAKKRDDFIDSVSKDFKEFDDELQLAEQEEKERLEEQSKANSAASSASTTADKQPPKRRSTISPLELKRASISTTGNRRRSSIFADHSLNNYSPKSASPKSQLSSTAEDNHRRKSLLPTNTTSRRVASSGIPLILQQYAAVNITDEKLSNALKSNELTVMAEALRIFLNSNSAAIKSYAPEKPNSQQTHDNIISQACAL